MKQPQLICICIVAVLGNPACSSDNNQGSGVAAGAGGKSSGTTAGKAGSGGSNGVAGQGTTATGGGAAGRAAGAGTAGANGSSGAAGSAGAAGTSSAAGAAGAAGRSGTAGTSGAAGASGTAGAGGAMAPPCDQVKGLVEAYKAAHPGNGGKDWDILAKSAAQIAADPAAQQLLSLCGPDQLPVIPLIAWEYGGGDHAWINPEMSALVYCVYIPVKPSSANWQYDAAQDHVTADVSVKCPDQNPCNANQGAAQVTACIGDPTNFEILVDTASINDGADAGLALSNASTDLNLISSDGTKVHLFTGT